jgi:hypothetical protein
MYAHIQPTNVCYVNICCAEELILVNTRITVHDTASTSGVLKQLSTETTVHKSVCLVGPKDVNFQAEGTAQCCVC